MVARLNQQILVGDPESTPLPHPLTICHPSSSEVPLGPQFCSCSPQHKNTLWGQPWLRELSLGQSLDCHYLQEKNNLWYCGKLLLKAFWLMWAAGMARSGMAQGSACQRLIQQVLVG